MVETLKEAQRRNEIREALTITGEEIYVKIAPLLLKMWKEIDRQDAAIEKLKRDVRRKE
jgi:hypothetical protein